jgi:hypothetical protein
VVRTGPGRSGQWTIEISLATGARNGSFSWVHGNEEVMMHFVRDVKYLSEYKLVLTFEDGSLRQVDLGPHLDGEVFEPLKEMSNFRSVHLNSDLDTIVWGNGADMSPDFLYEIGVPVAESVPAA